MNKERDELIKRHMPYIIRCAAKYRMSLPNLYEDLIQEGVLGLCRAMETFDESRGLKFLTYADYWIRGYMGRAARKENKYILVDDERFLESKEFLRRIESEDLEEDMIKKDIQDKAYDALCQAGVSTRDLDIVLSRYLADTSISLQEIGDRYGISRERVRQIEERMVKRLKRKLRK